MINKNVGRINNVCLDHLQDSIVFKRSFNIIMTQENQKMYDSECFQQYDEVSLSSHVLTLKVNMSIMLLRNLKPPIKCNETRARLTRIENFVLKTEIVDDKHSEIKIVILRVPLHSKDDKVGVSRRKQSVSCRFTRRQYSVRSIFAMIVNKSRRQSSRFVGIDLQMRMFLVMVNFMLSFAG